MWGISSKGTVRFTRKTVLHVIGWLIGWFAVWSGGELVVRLVSQVLFQHVDTLHCINVRFSHMPPKAQRFHFLDLAYC
jgi:hypothetical protein